MAFGVRTMMAFFRKIFGRVARPCRAASQGAQRGKITAPAARSGGIATAYVLETGQFSDPGCVRRRNEDSITVLAPQTGHGAGHDVLALVADGMGGHQAGDRASQLAVATIGRHFATSEGSPEVVLREAFAAANQIIFAEAQAKPAQQGMGTTATALAIVAGRAWLAHVGDSRLYRLRGECLEQLSEDHTMVMAMLRDGLLTPQQAKDHPNRHILVRAMGTHAQLEVMLAPVSLAVGDTFLLCSDGLHDLVEDEEIRTCLLTRGPQAACAALVGLARQRGGYDNVSVIVVHCAVPGSPQPGAPQTRDVKHTDDA